MMPKNAVEHVCHGHILMNTINRDGDDIYFVAKKKGLCISGIRGTLSFNRKKLTTGMLKSYLKSVRLFSTFCTSWFASGKASQNLQRKNAIYFLAKKKGLYISDIQGTLSFNGKKLTSGMLKSYLKSVQLFSTFVHHGLLVEKHFRISNEKMRKSAKVARKLQQNHTLFDYHTNDKCGEEAIIAFEDEDINHFYK